MPNPWDPQFNGRAWDDPDNAVEMIGRNTDTRMYQLPNYTANRSNAFSGAMRADSRGPASAMAAQINTGQSDQMRGRQMGLADLLDAQARGTGGPSAAELQMRRGADQNVANAMGMMAAQRGSNAGAAMRQIGQQRAAIGAQTNADAGLMRAQEQMSAQNQLGQLLTGVRGQDMSMATGQAQLQQQAGLANLQSSVQQRAMNDQMVQYYTSAGMSLDQAKLAAQQALDQISFERWKAREGINTQERAQNFQLVGAGASAIGGMMAMSDERLKEEIRPGDAKVYSFLDALNASEYRYKEPKKDGEGGQLSVMAQELEKSEVGRRFVRETPRGKAVDYAKGFAALLAGESALHKRLKALETKAQPGGNDA